MRIAGTVRLTDHTGATLGAWTNAAMDYVTSALAKSYTGAAGKIGDVSIEAVSIAVGSGQTPITVSDTALDSELLRKTATRVVTGSSVLFTVQFSAPEQVGPVHCVGLFGAAGSTGSTATGTLTLGGSPAAGDAIVVRVAGRSTSPFFVPTTSTAAAVAAQLKTHLEADDLVHPYFTLSASGSVITLTSRGRGTVYNQALSASVTGSTTVSVAGVSGGQTPGGALLHAAATNFRKRAGDPPMTLSWEIEFGG